MGLGALGPTATEDRMPSAPDAAPTACAATLDDATWTKLYTTYFAPGTEGHCGRCHGATPNGGLLVGDTEQSFLSGLVDRGLVDPVNPALSLLIDPQASPVNWFNPNGPMPRDNAIPNPQAAADVTAWLTSMKPMPCNAPAAGAARNGPQAAPGPRRGAGNDMDDSDDRN
jgi:hypothetical protein